MPGFGIDELAVETALVVHVEQIIGGAAIACQCGADAELYLTSEPDMEPGPVCRVHAFEWLNVTLAALAQLFPLDHDV